MKKYILIQNDGEIESNSFELIGASTKRNDETKIGFFGSGLKYSIAFMMRNNIEFKIFSGVNELVFTTQEEILKTQSFKRICIDGKPTSYTTTMGPTWELQWYVLREIYCNAIDEGSCQMVKSTEIVEPSQGKTRIYIELTPILESVINNWDAYFSDEREPLFKCDKVHTSYMYSTIQEQPIKVYRKTNGALFRKGVKVGGNDKFKFDYECEFVDINEDRTAKHLHSLNYGFASMAIQMSNENWLLSILRDATCGEYYALQGTSVYGEVNEKWIQFSYDYLLVVKEVSGKYANKIAESPKEALYIPSSFALELKNRLPEVIILGMGKISKDCAFEEIQLTPKMDFLLKEVLKSLEEMKYPVPYHISVAEFMEERILGKADIESKTIYIADKTFDMGRRELALTLMEECEHIKSKAEDETREFQTHIFSQWLKSMEESNGLFL
jgi:hypothetical protein